MATDEAELNIREHITRIDHAIAETAKYAVEQRKLEDEECKLDAEARLFNRGRWQGWQFVVTTMTLPFRVSGRLRPLYHRRSWLKLTRGSHGAFEGAGIVQNQ